MRSVTTETSAWGIGKFAGRDRTWKSRNSEVIAKAPLEYARTMPQMRKPEAGINVSQDSVKPREVNPSKRETTLAGSILEREERVPRLSGQHMEDIENCHHPDSTPTPSMDSFEYIFHFVLALIIVSFLMVQL
ncbi:unnamed protein product [Fraxinus pennsylvanica]|uniref:Uncharacterized protein n=1 Tax=Fraxinus pennsylvanica TaxID=56036 RepID=A0AAD1ZM11_9LAMI|nr:unnamed protein product [Fraxinus pennsylvanica]